MKRRTFLGTGMGTAAMASGASGLGGMQSNAHAAVVQSGSTTIGTIGGMTLEALREQYRYDLFDDFIAFFDKYIVDHDLGGFMCNANHDGSLNGTEKGTWYLGRGSWCWSFLYNNIAKEQKYLDVAEKAVLMLMKHIPKGDDYWPAELTKEGEVSNPKGGLPGDCYIAEGLAEFAKASGDKKYMTLAKQTMNKCWRHYESPTFQDGSSPYPGARNLWYWMLFMWFGTNNLAYESDPELEKRTAYCVEGILKHNNPKFNLMNNVVNHDCSTSSDPKHSELAGCGHATEALWMLMYEAVRTKNRTLFETASERFRRHVEVSWDDVYGGVFNDCRNVDEYTWQLEKIHWAEVFVLMGSLPMVEHQNVPWAKEWFARQNEWIRANFLLKPNGFMLWKETTDRKATFNPKSGRKDLYHHPRHLMLNLMCLDRMIKRGGKVSGLFS